MRMNGTVLGSTLLVVALLGACSDIDIDTDNLETIDPVVVEPPPPEFRYRASVTRTEYGIPHVSAEDWGSLGYGYGYAYAQDNYCVAMREIVFAGSRSSELMGEDGNLETDFLFRYLNGDKASFKEAYVDTQDPRVQDLIAGYADGLNRYLNDTGLDQLAEGDAGCRNASWVYEVDATDIWMYLRRIALGGSSDQGTIRRAIMDVTGPTMSAAAPPWNGADRKAIDRALQPVARSFRRDDGGSNAIAVGSELSQTGSGLLLGNPHQPWNGSGRWYEAHLTIPGEYDVAGASLQGLPWIGIGFNSNIAWTHTVAFSTRFTLYELQLNPDNPLQYDYDGEWRDIESETVTVMAQNADGELEERQHTFYRSHYGLMVNLKNVSPLLDGWPLATGTVLSMRDANLETGLRSATMWIGMGQAENLDEFTEAMKVIGNPVFHTFAADRGGEAFYGELSAIPHVTQTQLDTCINGVIGPLLAGSTGNAIISLDGSTSDCEWGEDADSPEGSNVYGYEARPKIRTREYVGNSNNSYWLSKPDEPLEGFPVVMGWMGHENMQQFLRTRITHIMVAERVAGSDGLSDSPNFDLATLQGLMYNNRVHGAEVVLDDVLQICAEADDGGDSASPAANAKQACAVLESWDRRADVDSRGTQVFHEFWRGIRGQIGDGFQNVVNDSDFWTVDFDPQDPIHTPRGIDLGLVSNHELVIDALNGAVSRLQEAGVALDAPWGEVQFFPRNNEVYPIHGGAGTMGVFGAISVSLDEGGYSNIRSGNSYIQTVTWDESDCPIADTILTHSQSTDPASPHFGDQTALYSQKQWVAMPYCEEDIEAARIGDTLILEELAE